MDEVSRTIRAFRLRVGILLGLRGFLRGLVVAGFAWGLAVLLLRVGANVDRTVLLWPLVAAAPWALVSAILAWRRVPSPSLCRALLDAHCDCGGLLMSADQADTSAWSSHLSPVHRPGLRWRGRKSWGLSAAAGAFLLVAFLVPSRYLDGASTSRLDVQRDVERIGLKLDALEELKILKPDRAEDLRKKLEQLRKQARGNDPVKTWESLDQIERTASEASQATAQKARADAERFAQVESAAGALKRAKDHMNAENLAAAMEQLSRMAKSAADQAGQLANNSARQAGKACENGLTPEELDRLAELAGQCQGEVLEDLERLCDAGLIDVETFRLCRDACEGINLDELAEKLCLAEGEELEELLKRGCPGRGGITRGRGDAPMTWTDGTQRGEEKFKPVVLPPSAIQAQKSKRIGLSLTAPKVDATAGPSASGALQKAAAGGGSAHGQRLLPRHRKAVRRYFDRTRHLREKP